MPDTRVLGARIGSMPYRAEIALAHARLARGLRHASRCSCGQGRAREGCTTDKRDAVLEAHAANNRARMNRYRANRVWQYSGSTPTR